MNLAYLRLNAPNWEWHAVRNGFGWNYRGVRAWEEVNVRPYSVLSGFSDDDFSTQWFAEMGRDSRPLFSWLLTFGGDK